MFAFIFVYSPSKFYVDGPEPFKRFEHASRNRPDYINAEPVIETKTDTGDTVVVLEKGIYATCAEGTARQFRELDPTRNTFDYDIAELAKDKDPWPSIIDVHLERDDCAKCVRRQRIRDHFGEVTEGDLTQFYLSRTAS